MEGLVKIGGTFGLWSGNNLAVMICRLANIKSQREGRGIYCRLWTKLSPSRSLSLIRPMFIASLSLSLSVDCVFDQRFLLYITRREETPVHSSYMPRTLLLVYATICKYEAGYCYSWSSPLPSGPAEDRIMILYLLPQRHDNAPRLHPV